MEDRTYNLNEVAMMTGFTTRTLRNYLNMKLLNGQKVDGAWQFTAEELERFFAEPFVREGLKTKRSSVVFDFLADTRKKDERTCIILDVPASMPESRKISDLFCKLMESAADTEFHFDWHGGYCRVILTGPEDQTSKIMDAYRAYKAGK